MSIAVLPSPSSFESESLAHDAAMLTWMHELVPFGVFTTDAELNVRCWNGWLAAHSGRSTEEMLGRPLRECFPELAARNLEEKFERALGGEVSILSASLHKYLLPFPSTVRAAGYTHMQQTARIAPLLSARGDVLGTITIIEDVTEREFQTAALRRQLQRDELLSLALAQLLESQDPGRDVGAIVEKLGHHLGFDVQMHYQLDAAGAELRLNFAAGVPAEQQRTYGVVKLGHGYAGECARLGTPFVLDAAQIAVEPRAAGARELRLTAFAVLPLQVGDRMLGVLAFGTQQRETLAPDEPGLLATLAQYVAIALDRGQREKALLRAEQSLREHAKSLEFRIAERTARLHETIAQLESFSYTVAHDLRAPIRALKGFSDVLLSDYSESLPPQGRYVAERLGRAGDQLDALTRDLLKFSKLSRAEIDLAPVDIGDVVRDITVLNPALQSDVLTLHPPFGAVWGQRTLLQQCLSNLLDNALKFARPGVPPQIAVRVEVRAEQAAGAAKPPPFIPAAPPELARQRDEARTMPRLRIWVEDNGIGIPPHAHEKIFGIFERVSGLEGVEGTGIGLAIVARAAQQMDGACGVESALGAGSRFWLDLWAAEVPAPPLPVAAVAL